MVRSEDVARGGAIRSTVAIVASMSAPGLDHLVDEVHRSASLGGQLHGRRCQLARDRAADEVVQRPVDDVAERALGVREPAVDAAIRRSHSTARSKPPASAGPLIAAIVGSGKCSTVSW